VDYIYHFETGSTNQQA